MVGGLGLLYGKPIIKHLQRYNAIFRKPWMKPPVYGAVFLFFGYVGLQLPARIFPKWSSSNPGVTHATFSSQQDMVSRFRIFDNVENPDQRDNIASYLSLYTTEPLTKSEMIDNIALNAMKNYDLGSMFRVKRRGKDKDPFFWSFGKVHGLENIAFADPQEVRDTQGNPVKIQRIVDRMEGP